MAEKGQGERAFSGLILVFCLSFLSLFGVLLTVAALGGLGEWTRWQFIGLFGLVEAASGLANIVVPNIWRLPVVELERPHRAPAKLAASTMVIPHWGGVARIVAGAVLLAAAGYQEGLGSESLTLVPMVVLIAIGLVALSALVARLGVVYAELDVFQFTLRWRRRDIQLAPVSFSTSALQFLLGIMTIPIVKVLPPSVLYQPEIGASFSELGLMAAFSLGLALVALLAWAGRIDWRASGWQQREAEQNA
jgi:hypothetical protein